jgi:hypothetical protein
MKCCQLYMYSVAHCVFIAYVSNEYRLVSYNDALMRAAVYTDSQQPQQQQHQLAVGGERSLYEEPIFLMDPVQFSIVRKQKGLGRGEADRYSGGYHHV